MNVPSIFRQPVVLGWLAGSFIIMTISILMSIFMPSNTFVVITAVLLSQFSSSIFFPILVGYFYDRLKEQESGEAIWKVFREFSNGGIIRIYKDREESPYPEDAIAELRQALLNHRHGEVKLIGVSLRVFFNPTGPFFQTLSTIAALAGTNPNVRIKALLAHPESPAVAERAEIETPDIAEPLILKDISLTTANIENLSQQFTGNPIEYGYYREAPYCTLVIFPDRCFYSPNILSRVVPVRLPMIIFRSASHGYRVLNDYFEYIWSRKVDLSDHQSN